MALIEPGPFEKFTLWLKRLFPTPKANPEPIYQTPVMGKAPVKVWTKKLDSERRVEVIARSDDLFSFREMKLVSNKDGKFDVTIFESGLYDDLKEITLAVSDYILNGRQRTGS